MSTELMASEDNVTYLPPANEQTDAGIIALWLHGRSPETIRAYTRDVAMFLQHVKKPLRFVSLGDLQDYADSLENYAPSSKARHLAAVKSLMRFASISGLLIANPAAALRLPKVPNRLAERILDEETVSRILAFLPAGRDRVLVRLLYGSGIRASELYGLRWRDCQPRGDAGQITVTGKGTKTRSILLSAGTWRELADLGRGDPDEFVFLSYRGRPLTESTVWRVVRTAARAAGVTLPVSPHWMRHAHASHALDRGAPIHLVKETLGHASLATTGKYAHARPNDSSARYLPV